MPFFSRADGTLRLIEPREQLFLFVFRDTDAGIGDDESKVDAIARCPVLDLHRELNRAFLRKLHRVSDEVGEHLAHALGVADDLGGEVRVDIE